MLKTFTKGGVHPPENKFSVNESIKDLPIEGTVAIPLSMHLGAPAKPLVNKGDTVKTGQLIAKGDGFVSANIHSPVSGKVLKLDKALNSSGYKRDAVYISIEGDEWDESIDRSDTLIRECSLSPSEIIQKINDAGIVGLGGATFPSHVKLTVPRGKKAEYLVINGVECEPYLTSDHRLMLEKSEELMVGISILQKALQVEQAIIGIENNKPDAIAKLTELAANYPNISVQPLKVKYPQGGEKQLIFATLGRVVPTGGLPLDIGVVVSNVATAAALAGAVLRGRPLTHRVLTVTGNGVAEPKNLLVPIGISYGEILEACGGLTPDAVRVVAGGPMYTCEPEKFEDVDHLVLNEAEITLPIFLADLERGTPKRVYATDEYADIRQSPVPRWDLIDMRRYASMSIQFSRGCPFNSKNTVRRPFS